VTREQAAETRTSGVITTTGAPFEAPAIQVFRIRAGKILLLRDYFSPGVMPAAPSASAGERNF
jgi:ketosteroid isomerase-like protein